MPDNKKKQSARRPSQETEEQTSQATQETSVQATQGTQETEQTQETQHGTQQTQASKATQQPKDTAKKTQTLKPKQPRKRQTPKKPPQQSTTDKFSQGMKEVRQQGAAERAQRARSAPYAEDFAQDEVGQLEFQQQFRLFWGVDVDAPEAANVPKHRDDQAGEIMEHLHFSQFWKYDILISIY